MASFRYVIYTSIFGNKDELLDCQFQADDIDYICFSDVDLKSNVWKVVRKDLVNSNFCRTSRKYKILAHKFLPEYEVSIFVDGNFQVRKHPKDLIDNFKYLSDANLAVFDHNDPLISLNPYPQYRDPRNCIYEEAVACKRLRKDDPFIIDSQIAKYKSKQYPKNNGLISSAVLIRRHNESDVVKTMEDWWEEICSGSKRDQLSFNYVAWINNLNFNYIQGDIRNNEYFRLFQPHRHNKLK